MLPTRDAITAMAEPAPPEPRPSAAYPRDMAYKSHPISLQPRVDTLQDFHGLVRDAFRDSPAITPAQQSAAELFYPDQSTEKILEPPPARPASMAHAPLPPPPAVKMSTLREVLFVFVVAMAHFTTQAALGQALVPLPIIAESFDVTNPGQAVWFVAGYSLTVGTFILISGRLGDIIGHKRMFCFGYAWFGVWAAFAGFAAYPGRQVWFDICRAMQGIGPAITMPNGLALFGRAYPPGIKKNIVFSIFGAVAPAGFVTGAFAGSLFGQLAWWPWAFWTLALAVWGLLILALIVIPPELSQKPLNPPGFDWSGSFLGVLGLVLINIAWNNAPMYGWSHPTVYFVLIIGLLCMGGFVWVEKRAISPILPLQALNGTALFVLGCIGLGWGSFGIWVFYITRFLETVRDYAPLSVVAQFGPVSLCGLIASGMTGFMLTHTPVSFTMLVSMCAFCIGSVIAGTQPVRQTYWAQTFVSMLIMPFGMDMSFPAASIILSNHMPAEHQGLAMSLVNTVLNYSISIALGIAGTVEVNVAKPGRNTNPNDKAFLMKGYRASFYTGIAVSALGVVLGVMFFARSMLKEGWKVMDH